jgi:hypothetical protein
MHKLTLKEYDKKKEKQAQNVKKIQNETKHLKSQDNLKQAIEKSITDDWR